MFSMILPPQAHAQVQGQKIGGIVGHAHHQGIAKKEPGFQPQGLYGPPINGDIHLA